MSRRGFLSALAVSLLVAGSALAGAPQNLRVAVDGNYPPFSMVDQKGRLTGFDIEMADEICKRIQAKCTKVRVPWEDMVDSVNTGKAEMVVASTSITPSRRLRVAFSNRYYHTPAMFMRRKGDSRVDGLVGDMRGKVIGVQRLTTHDQFITTELGNVATIKRFTTVGDLVNALMSKQVDTILADAWALQSGPMKDKVASSKLEMIGPPYINSRWFGEGIGVVMAKSQTDLKTEVDRAIASMRDDGTYTRIASKYFNYDVYGQ